MKLINIFLILTNFDQSRCMQENINITSSFKCLQIRETILRQKLTIQTASKLGAQFIRILANKGSYFDFENVQTNSQKLFWKRF